MADKEPGRAFSVTLIFFLSSSVHLILSKLFYDSVLKEFFFYYYILVSVWYSYVKCVSFDAINYSLLIKKHLVLL